MMIFVLFEWRVNYYLGKYFIDKAEINEDLFSVSPVVLAAVTSSAAGATLGAGGDGL